VRRTNPWTRIHQIRTVPSSKPSDHLNTCPHKALCASTSPSSSSSGRANLTVRELLARITDRLDDGAESDWTKTRNYLYQASDKLSVEQIDRVLIFLQGSFPNDTVRLILQLSPRILRKNCNTNLRPTLELLEQLYGSERVRIAVRRNPGLLLTRGTGYDADALELVEVFLKQELDLTPSSLKKLKETLPVLFQTKVYKLLSVIHFFRCYLSETLSHEDASASIAKLLVIHPQIFLLSVEKGLEPKIQLLKERCDFASGDIANLIQSSSAGAILGLSVQENLKPKLDFLSERLAPEQLRKTVKSHPQLLGLSLANIREKLSFFDGMEQHKPGNVTISRVRSSLASRILLRAPSVFSHLPSIQARVDMTQRRLPRRMYCWHSS
jgi:hypothetical protein